MRQWDIYLYSFQQENPHPVVILSNDELCANPDILYINSLIRSSLRADRSLKRRESILEPTVVYSLEGEFFSVRTRWRIVSVSGALTGATLRYWSKYLRASL